MSESGDKATSKESDKYETACNRLAREAVLRFSGDNVTVLILAIHKSKQNNT
mgnify:CR=1 FL=1